MNCWQILGIFAAFGRADVGMAVAGLLLLPVAAWAWMDFALLRHRAAAYARECKGFGVTTSAAPGE